MDKIRKFIAKILGRYLFFFFFVIYPKEIPTLKTLGNTCGIWFRIGFII